MNALVAVVSTGISRDEIASGAQVAAKGVPCLVVGRFVSLHPSPTLKCLVVDQEFVDEAIAALPSFPSARILVLCDGLSTAMLAAALREPRILGFVSDSHDHPSAGEVAYIVRRALTRGPAVPLISHFDWSHTQVSFTVGNATERTRVIDAVKAVGLRFGITERLARKAQAATAYFVDAALATAAASERTQKADSADSADNVKIQLALDATRFGIEVSDSFGAMKRSDVFGPLLRTRKPNSTHASSKAFNEVHAAASSLRFYVEPEVTSRSTFLANRDGSSRPPMSSLHWEQHDPAPALVPPTNLLSATATGR